MNKILVIVIVLLLAFTLSAAATTTMECTSYEYIPSYTHDEFVDYMNQGYDNIAYPQEISHIGDIGIWYIYLSAEARDAGYPVAKEIMVEYVPDYANTTPNDQVTLQNTVMDTFEVVI